MATFKYPGNADNLAKTNYEFVQKLWNAANGQALRDRLLNQPNLGALQAELRTHGFVFQPEVQIILVDIEGARTKNYPDPIDKNGKWYVLVMAPVPRRSSDPEYKELQAWSEASFHASNDGYGM